jgi:hypothetical protein
MATDPAIGRRQFLKRVSGDDAKELAWEFAASVEGVRLAAQQFDLIAPASELQNLPDYKLYVKTLLDGGTLEAIRGGERSPAFGGLCGE